VLSLGGNSYVITAGSFTLHICVMHLSILSPTTSLSCNEWRNMGELYIKVELFACMRIRLMT